MRLHSLPLLFILLLWFPISGSRVKNERTVSFKADFLCFNPIIIEAKAVQLLNNNFQAQVINYLKGSHLRLGLLLNFGEPSLKIKRLIN